jgi:hypothetical protein
VWHGDSAQVHFQERFQSPFYKLVPHSTLAIPNGRLRIFSHFILFRVGAA